MAFSCGEPQGCNLHAMPDIAFRMAVCVFNLGFFRDYKNFSECTKTWIIQGKLNLKA